MSSLIFRKYVHFLLLSGMLLFQNLQASGTGLVSGIIQLDSTWESEVYLSVIHHFEEMNMMSYSMIIAEDTIDEQGNFEFNISFLPATDCLLRLHVVKKGTSPASLIVGGEEENNTFLVANNTSDIQIYTLGEKPVFKAMLIANSPKSKAFHYLTELVNYPNVIDYGATPLDKRFVEEVVNEKLKLYADTCESSVLLALYALRNTDVKEDYKNDPQFYDQLRHKWGSEQSIYFQAFEKQLPQQQGFFVWWFALGILVFGSALFMFRRKSKKKEIVDLQELSIQERKIYEMLRQGASNKEIAEEFHIGISTVKTHVSRIFSKLNVKSRKEVMDL